MSQQLVVWVKAHGHLMPWVAVGTVSLLLHLTSFVSIRRLRREVRRAQIDNVTRPLMKALLGKIANELNRLGRVTQLLHFRINEVEIQHTELAQWTETSIHGPTGRKTMPFPWEVRRSKPENRKAVYPWNDRTTLIPDGSPTPSEVDLSWPDEPPLAVTKVETLLAKKKRGK